MGISRYAHRCFCGAIEHVYGYNTLEPPRCPNLGKHFDRRSKDSALFQHSTYSDMQGQYAKGGWPERTGKGEIAVGEEDLARVEARLSSLRQQLTERFVLSGSLTDPELLAISAELDQVVLELVVRRPTGPGPDGLAEPNDLAPAPAPGQDQVKDAG